MTSTAGQLTSVHPDLAEDALLLVADHDAVGRAAEQRSAAVGNRVCEQIAREAKGIAGNERIVGHRFRDRAAAAGSEVSAGPPVRLVLLEYRLARWRHRRHRIRLVADARSDPGSRQIVFERGSRRVRHLRDAFGDESLGDGATLRRGVGRVRGNHR